MAETRRQFGPSTRVLAVVVVMAATSTIGLPIIFRDRWPMPAAVVAAYLAGGASAAVGIFLWFRSVLRGVGAAIRNGLPPGPRPAPAESPVPLVRRAESFFEAYPNVTNVVTAGLLPFIGGVLTAMIGVGGGLAIALLT